MRYKSTNSVHELHEAHVCVFCGDTQDLVSDIRTVLY